MSEQLKIRPYARLLTMLGDQLIKNEQIAVTELMKNSYDADADYNILKINVSEWNEGIYLVKIQTAQGQLSRRVSIVH